MAYDDREKIIRQIEKLRGRRVLVSFCNFDRTSVPELPGLNTHFHANVKECLYRVLKESRCSKGLDLFLYTRGGDTNSVWPIVNLLREFDKDFQVLVPFRAHSAGTMLALAAKKAVMARLELCVGIGGHRCQLDGRPVHNGQRIELLLPGGRWLPARLEGLPRAPCVVLVLGGEWEARDDDGDFIPRRPVLEAPLPPTAELRWPRPRAGLNPLAEGV